MAKKICELCGMNLSTDMRFGVNLCHNCLGYYNSPNLVDFINHLSFERATPAAKQLFEEKISMNASKEKQSGALNEQVQEELKKRQERRQEEITFWQEQERRRQEDIMLWQEQERRRQETEAKQTQELIEQRKKDREAMDLFLKENGHEGYYEYKVLNVYDPKHGMINSEQIATQLNYLGRQGWHLRCAFANELAHNASSTGVGGFYTATNGTVDQSILILERFIKFK